MAETTCPICGREKNAMSWLPGREWCGGPIDPDAMIECYRLGYERERAARERAEEALGDAFEEAHDERKRAEAAESALAQARRALELIIGWCHARVDFRDAMEAILQRAADALAAAPRGEPAASADPGPPPYVCPECGGTGWPTAIDSCATCHGDLLTAAGEPRAKGDAMSRIDLTGLDKAEVLMALYDRARPQGMGFLHYKPDPLTHEQAVTLLEASSYFDYWNGRVMKVDLSGDNLEPRLYDRDNGPGAAAEVIRLVRARAAPAQPKEVEQK